MIKLFTDSGANLPLKLIKKYDIKVIAFSYYSEENEEAEIQADFDIKNFYYSMRKGKVYKTSMINIDTFTKSFKKELINNNDIIYIGMSSGISGTFGAANAAKNYLSKIFKDRQIQVIDSRGASLGEGMVVLEAAKLIAQGLSFNTIVNCVRKLLPNMCQIFTVDDLKYLKSTGRVSSAAAIVGSMLGIRPLLIGSDEGKIIMNGKVRGMTKALDAIADKYDKLVLEKRSPIGIAHADNEKAVKYLLKKLREKGFCGKEIVEYYEPVTGSHVGPGTVAMFFYGQSRTAL